jgi:valyl-tRNA synthetase
MQSMSQLLTMIEAVRALKKDYNLKPSADINVIIKDENNNIVASNASINAILQRMCHATWIDEATDEEMASRTILNGTLNVPLAAVINVEEEIKKLEKEVKRLLGEIKRGEGMLSNPRFTEKAPAAKVEEERNKLEGYKNQYAIVEKQLADMKQKLQ